MNFIVRKAFQVWLPDRSGSQPGIVILAESKDEAIEMYKQRCMDTNNGYQIEMIDKNIITFDQIGVLSRSVN